MAIGAFGSPCYLLAEEALDACPATAVAVAHQSHGYSFGICACCAAYAVYVVLGIVRHIVVHHHCNLVDVDAAGHNVGGHEQVDASGTEIEHHVLASLLVEVGVHLARFESSLRRSRVSSFTFSFDEANTITRLAASSRNSCNSRGVFSCSWHMITD